MRVRAQAEALQQHVGALGHTISAQTVITRGINEDVAQRQIPVEVELLRRKADETPSLAPLPPEDGDVSLTGDRLHVLPQYSLVGVLSRDGAGAATACCRGNGPKLLEPSAVTPRHFTRKNSRPNSTAPGVA